MIKGIFSNYLPGNFSKNPHGIIALFGILVFFTIAVFAYVFAPDSTENAARQNLVISQKPPGYKQLMLKIPYANYQKNKPLSEFFFGSPIRSDVVAIQAYRIENDQLIYTPFIGEGLAGDEQFLSLETWQKHGYTKDDIQSDFVYIQRFILGTDRYGRDFLSRLLVGTRISFFVGFMAVLVSLVVGILVGALGGYYRGKVDQVVMFLINVLWSVPTLLLVIALTLALGKGFWQIFLAVGLTMWVEVARVVRGQFISLREKEFVEAARAMGFGDWRIMFKHLLPNTIGPLIVISAANFAAAILIESGLSFLGVGAQPPTPSWGNIIKEHYSYIPFGNQHLAIFPGLFIMFLVLAFNIFGNSIRDVADVKA